MFKIVYRLENSNKNIWKKCQVSAVNHFLIMKKKN